MEDTTSCIDRRILFIICREKTTSPNDVVEEFYTTTPIESYYYANAEDYP